MGVTLDRPARPAHRDPGLLALILIGGSVGTLARAVLEDAAPAAPRGLPWTTLGINVCGAFVLAVLLGVLLRLGPDSGRRRAARLTLGTGVLGGFTTYSTLALEAVHRAEAGAPLLALGYAVGSVVLGASAAAAGVAVVARAPRTKARP